MPSSRMSCEARLVVKPHVHSFKTYNVTRNDFTSLDLFFHAVTHDDGLHGNITFETGDNIGSLFLLVPTDNSVQHQDTNDDTEVDPVTKTSSEEDSKLHDWKEGVSKLSGMTWDASTHRIE